MMRQLVRKLHADNRAMVAIEFALLGLLYFGMIMAIIEVALIMLSQVALDNAVLKVGRRFQTGELQQKSTMQADFRQLLCAEAGPIFSCSGLMFDLRSYATFAAVPTSVPMLGTNINVESFGFDPPAAGSFAALQVFYKWPMTTPLIGQYLATMNDGARFLVGTAVFKTEPF